MANVVEVTKIQDGPRNAIFHIYLQSDGASGELSNVTLIDPAVDFDPALPASPILIIEKLWYDITGFDGILKFEDLVNETPVWTLSGHGHFLDFSPMGGLKDRSDNLDGTGKILLATTGFTTLGEQGTIILQVKKHYPQ
jgi:hypothetical protein